jgi:hypothetical protein
LGCGRRSPESYSAPLTATWCNLSQDDRESPKSVYAVSEEVILDGCYRHWFSPIGEGGQNTASRVWQIYYLEVQRLIDGSKSAEIFGTCTICETV